MAFVVVAACGSADPVDGIARSTAAYNLIVDAVTETEFDPVVDGEPLPVVYLAGRDDEVPFDVQVAVAATYLDLVDIRFADVRTEAIDEGLDDLPVRDAGVLVVVGPVPDSGRRFEVELEVYRNRFQTEMGRALVRWSDGDWVLESVDFDVD